MPALRSSRPRAKDAVVVYPVIRNFKKGQPSTVIPEVESRVVAECKALLTELGFAVTDVPASAVDLSAFSQAVVCLSFGGPEVNQFAAAVLEELGDVLRFLEREGSHN